ncbi:MAG: S9 family peptidase [Candidatus Kariarchaeaceae archaeon]|jgi:dipeptidyl aminopeptidase/acylaminoacyl peptidase
MTKNTPLSRGFWDGIPLDMFSGGYTYNSPTFSSNGNHVAYTKTDENGTHLHLYDVEVREHWQLTSDHPLSTGTPYGGKTFTWGANAQSLYFSSKGQLYQISVDGGVPEKLQSIDKSFSPFTNEKYLLYSIEHDDDMSLGIQLLNSSSWVQRIPYSRNFLYDAVIHPNNRSIALHAWSFPYMSWNQSEIVLLFPENDDYTMISERIIAGGEGIATSQPRFSPNGEYISYFCDKNGWLNLWVAKADGTDARPLVDEPREHAYSTWVTGGSNQVWLDAGRIAFTRNVNGFLTLAVVNVLTGSVDLLSNPDGFYEFLHASPDGNYLTYNFQDHETKGRVELLNVQSAMQNDPDSVERTIIANSGLKLSPGIRSKLVKPENVTFPTKDSQHAHGLLYIRSDDSGQRNFAPLIMMVHGGPTGMSSNKFNLPIQYFTSRGFAVFAINYRGSIGFGRDFRERLNGNWGTYDVDDSVDALEYLQSEGYAKKNKSTIMGRSAGGYTVLMTLARQPGKFKVGVDLFGVADNLLFAEETHYLESRYADTLVGPLPEASAKYFKQSPLYIAENIVDPLLILQGEDDPVVPKNQSELIRDQVKGHVEYKLYKGEGHGFKRRETLEDMYPRIEKFIRKFVLYDRE